MTMPGCLVLKFDSLVNDQLTAIGVCLCTGEASRGVVERKWCQ